MAFKRFAGRAIGVLILALTPWVLLAIGVHAQAPPNLPPPGAYQPIPNFTGVGAGLQFRQAINDRFSGAMPIAPAVVRIAFANLPTEQDGALIYCTNCSKTIPCAAGGSGAWASGQNGQWMCGAPAFSPIGDVNFNGHRATNLASGAVAGDALTFGQVGSQLGAYIQPSVVGVATAMPGSTSVTINRPSGTVAGELLVFAVGVQSSTLVVTPPVGVGTWSLIRADCTTDRCQAIYQKVAGNSEPPNYTFTLSTGAYGEAAMVAVANQNAISPIDATSQANTNSTPASVTIPAPATTSQKDLNLVFFTNPGFPHALTAPSGGKPIVDSSGAGFGGFYYTAPTTSATVQAVSAGGSWDAVQVAIAPVTVTGAPAIRDTAAGFTANIATATPNYSGAANPMTGYGVDGCFNPIAYGADPTGLLDNSAAFDAAYNAACAANNPPTGSTGALCIPNGTFNFFAPFLAMCPAGYATAQTPDIIGAGKTATVLLNNIGFANAIGGGPLLELASPIAVSSLGGSAGLISAGLTAGGGNSFNWQAVSVLFNLDQIFGDQALNGKATLDIKVIFTTPNVATTQYLISSDGSAAPQHGFVCFNHAADHYYTCGGAVALWTGTDGKLRARINTSVTGITLSNLLVSASALSANTTYMAELSYDGSNVRLLHGTPGGTSTMDAKVAQTGSIVQRTDENLVLGAQAEYWNMASPSFFWKGKMDSVQISTTARCVNDSGCSIANAKLSGDSNTLFLENWGNVSNLPLVEPEYTNGLATDQNAHQSWMSMYNIALGSSAGNSPTLRDFSIRGGQVGIHANVVSPHLQRIDMTSGPNYGIMLDQINDYGGTIDDVQLSDNVIPISIVGGITFVTRVGITCGVTCMELVGTSVRDAILLPESRTQWGIILTSGAHLDDIILDTENGGAFPVIQMSDMQNTTAPSLELSSSEVQSWGASMPPIAVDGQYQSITITNTQLLHGTGVTGPFIDLSKASTVVASGINFQNDTYDGKPEPSDIAGNSYASATDINGNPVWYTVVGGGSARQTTLAGTTAGTFVWSTPGEGSSYKRFVGHYTGYNNTTAGAQTITYPIAFSLAPKITTNDGPSGSTSTTAFTLPASMGTPVTGWIIVEGY